MAQEEMLPEILVTPEPEAPQPGISLGVPQNTLAPTGISLPNPVVSNTMPTPDTAAKRTERTEFAVGDRLKKPTSEIYSDYISGQEQALRAGVASDIDKSKSEERLDRVRNVALANPGGLTYEQMKWAAAPFEPTNPNSVIEKEFATKFISETVPASARMGAPLLPEAMQNMPQHVEKVKTLAEGVMAKNLYIQGIIEDLSKEVEQQGTLPWLADMAKGITQIYPEAKMRGNIPGSGVLSSGAMLGDNLVEQSNILYSQPMEQFQKSITDVITRLRKDNPALALEFAKNMLGQAASEVRLNNLFSLFAIPDTTFVAGLAAKGIKGADMARRVNTAYKQIIEEQAHTAGPVKAVAAESAGDLAEGAVQRVIDNTVTNNPKPIVNAIEMLPDVFDLTKNFTGDAAIYGSGKPTKNLSREGVVRLENQMIADGQAVGQAIDTAVRVNRTKLPLAVEVAVRAMKDGIRDLYPGIRNTILNIGDPFRHGSTNTLHVEMTLGNYGGELFSTIESAQGFAKLNGLGKVSVLMDEGIITPKAVEKAIARQAVVKDQLELVKEAINKQVAIYTNKKLPSEVREEALASSKFFAQNGKKYVKELSELDTKINGRKEFIGPVIEQHGMGYKIVITKPLREIEDSFREYSIKLGKDAKEYEKGFVSAALDGMTPGSNDIKGYRGWMNAAIGKLRGADDTFSFNENVQRKVATYGKKVLMEVADSMSKRIEDVVTGVYRFDPVTGDPIAWYKRAPVTFLNKITLKNKEMFEQFNETLKYAKDAPNPNTGKKGYYFQTPGELEDHYMRAYKRFPTFGEHQAYVAHVELLEFDRVLGEMAEFRNRSRLGVEQHAISVLDATGKRISSSYFDGVVKKDLPRTDDHVMVMGLRQGDERVTTLDAMSRAEHKSWKAKIDSGEYQLIDIFNPGHFPLQGFSKQGGEHIRYVLTKNSEVKPLEFNHVDRRAGGHFDYDYNLYIKQAKMNPMTRMENDTRRFQHLYTGDTTVMPIDNRALGKDVIKHLEAARILIRDGKDKEAMQYLQANQFPVEWKTLKGWFSESTDPVTKMISKPMLDVNEPFYVVNKSQKIYDIDKTLEDRYKGTWKDGTKSGSLASQNQVAWNMERDDTIAKTINDYGTMGNPLYKYEPSDLIDPIPTMNRALDRLINSTFMDDYKIMAVENWLREATPWLREGESSIKNSPFWNFHNATSKDAFKPSTPVPVLNNLLANKYKIEQFLGVPDKFDTFMHGLTQSLLDSAYSRFGAETGRTSLQKAITVAPIWMLGKLKDPVSLLRGFAFNAKLGLFAVPQLLTQMQTYASIWALEPRNGLAGTYGMMLHQWARINQSEEFIKTLDKMATKINFGGMKWKEGEFAEAWRTMKETGFEKVSGEHAIQDNVKHKYIGDSFGNLLKAGQVFFHEGERSVRIGAWYTAFRKFREEFPKAIITNDIKAQILNQADLLSNNMSRASNSMLHGGVLSLPTQFLSYQMRLAELFWGKRLGETLAERNWARTRMVTTYGALYGAPTAIGLTGLPLADDIRQNYIDRGYVPNEKFIESLVMQGLPNIMLNMATGGQITKDGPKLTGNDYNVGPKLGIQGFSQLQDFFKSDKSTFTMLGGASVSIFSNALTGQDGFLRAMTSMIRGDNGDMAFKFTPSTFTDPLRELASFNSALTYVAALHTGKWFSKQDAYLTDVSQLNALFMTLTGLSPTEQSDRFLKMNIKKDEEAAQKWALKKFITDFRRGAQAAGTNPELSKMYYTNAYAYLYMTGFPLEKRASATAIAAKGYENIIKSSDYDYYLKNNPVKGRSMFGMFEKEGKGDLRRDQFKRSLQVNDARKAQ